MQEKVDFFQLEAEKLHGALSDFSGAFTLVSKKLGEQGIKLSRNMVGMVLSGERIGEKPATKAKYAKVFVVGRQVGFELQTAQAQHIGNMLTGRIPTKRRTKKNATPAPLFAST